MTLPSVAAIATSSTMHTRRDAAVAGLIHAYDAFLVSGKCHWGSTVKFSPDGRGKWAPSPDQKNPRLSHGAPGNLGLLHLCAQNASQAVYVEEAKRAVRRAP
jgi:hypothetical protein